MLRIVPLTVPRVGRSYEHFPDGFELHLLPFRSENLLGVLLQGYLAQKKYSPPWTLQKEYTQGHMVVLVGGAISCERGTPVYEASGPSELVDRSLWR